MKISKKIKQISLTTAVALATLPALTACTDEEVGAAIGVIIIGGIIAGAADHGHEDNRDRDDHRGRDDRGGRDDHGGGMDHGGRNGGRRLVTAIAEANVANTLDNQGVDRIAFAQKYNLSTQASDSFIDAMESAKAGNGQAVIALGLNHDDLNAISKYEMPSYAAIENIANHIQADKEQTRFMVSDLLAQASAAKQAQ